MHKLKCIDSHAHCGVLDQSWPQGFEDYARQAAGSGIDGVAFFSPVMEIYDRCDANFEDTPSWQQRRRQSNTWLLDLQPADMTVFPYFFIWNDFAVDQLSPQHRGIKWHRHQGEPGYHYDDPKCRVALETIRLRNLPVVLEETYPNTLKFVRELADGITLIIPHLGMLNGGFEALAEADLWALPNVWADTALASRAEIAQYLAHYGHRRLMFGSDFPFGDPAQELRKIRRMALVPEVEAALLMGNFMRLQARIARTV